MRASGRSLAPRRRYKRQKRHRRNRAGGAWKNGGRSDKIAVSKEAVSNEAVSREAVSNEAVSNQQSGRHAETWFADG
jgi:hypothetical protein